MYINMSRKRKLTLLVDESPIELGKRLGLNLSRYFETQIEKSIQNSEANPSGQIAYKPGIGGN